MLLVEELHHGLLAEDLCGLLRVLYDLDPRLPVLSRVDLDTDMVPYELADRCTTTVTPLQGLGVDGQSHAPQLALEPFIAIVQTLVGVAVRAGGVGVLEEVANEEGLDIGPSDLQQQGEVVAAEILDLINADQVVVPFQASEYRWHATHGIQGPGYAGMVYASSRGHIPTASGDLLAG